MKLVDFPWRNRSRARCTLQAFVENYVATFKCDLVSKFQTALPHSGLQSSAQHRSLSWQPLKIASPRHLPPVGRAALRTGSDAPHSEI